MNDIPLAQRSYSAILLINSRHLGFTSLPISSEIQASTLRDQHLAKPYHKAGHKLGNQSIEVRVRNGTSLAYSCTSTAAKSLETPFLLEIGCLCLRRGLPRKLDGQLWKGKPLQRPGARFRSIGREGSLDRSHRFMVVELTSVWLTKSLQNHEQKSAREECSGFIGVTDGSCSRGGVPEKERRDQTWAIRPALIWYCPVYKRYNQIVQWQRANKFMQTQWLLSRRLGACVR